jgi:fucose permease
LAVAIAGLAIAPVFPALVSGTQNRVGRRYAANTIGMQIGSAGIGAAAVPGLAGVMARRISLEVIPLYLVVLFAVLFGLHVLSLRPQKTPGT